MDNNFSWLDKTAKFLAIPGFVFAALSLGWQVYTYRESHEESPMVRGVLTQDIDQFNRDTRGKLRVEVTNLGKQAMQIKTITLSVRNRVWVLHSPSEDKPTFLLETGHTLAREIEWNYRNYPIFEWDESQPADFLVQVETTRGVHQQHVAINEITLTSTVPKSK